MKNILLSFKLLSVIIMVFIASNLFSATVTYYQWDGKGTVSDTMNVGVSYYSQSMSDGSDGDIELHNNGGTLTNTRAYLSFPNIFGTGQYQIPEDAVISSATLQLCKISMNNFDGNGKIYKVTSSWNESSLNWNMVAQGQGGYNSSTVQNFSFSFNRWIYVSLNVTSTVQQWANDPSTNFGWMYAAAEQYGASTFWATDDNSVANYRPHLTITYNPLQWVYIKNNKTNLSETWTDAQVDTLYNLFFAGSGNSTVNNEKWNFCNLTFNEKGLWGTEHNIGQGWTDKYGFKHIYLSENKSISTFDDLSFSEEWEYIAAAGCSFLFNEEFDADWIKADIDALNNLYLAKKGSVVLSDGSIWYYTKTDYSRDGFWGAGKSIGDYWVDSMGNRHIYLGSGLTDFNPVPEPFSISLIISGLIGFMMRNKMYSRK